MTSTIPHVPRVENPDIDNRVLDKRLIQLRNVSKTYHVEGREVQALKGVDLEIARGEFLVLVGRSGCGKSTLLNLLGGLDKPTSGEVLVSEKNVGAMNDAQLTSYRRETVGIVFQFFNLMPLLTAAENVSLPALLSGKNKAQMQARARELLEHVGLGHRIEQQVSLLSGGEMQRVALARALINDPQLILADEPTGNLDSRSAEPVLQTLRDLASQGKTVAMVTHSREAATQGTQVREMRDGVFVD
jgi:putative ABC transport system ATP-binding protein